MILLSLLLLFPQNLQGWDTLADVTIKWQYVQKYGQKVEIPVFGPSLKARDGKEIVVSGYFVPSEMAGNTIILSKMPFAQCFFCGGAGMNQ